MSEIHIIPATDAKTWQRVLDRCHGYDAFHLSGIHLSSQQIEGGQSLLIVYEDGNDCAALPIIVRPVSSEPGLESFDLCDATSIYGYTGVITNVVQRSGRAVRFRHQFQSALRSVGEQLGIVSFVLRTHPLLDTHWLLTPWAELHTTGPIVVIDLTQPDAVQRANYSHRVRRDLRRAHEHNVQVVEVPYEDSLDEFISIYNETMLRNDAREYYYFPREHYLGLRWTLGDRARMYFAKLADETISAAICLMMNGFIHIHFAGSPNGSLAYSGIKVIIDHVRAWGTESGFRWFNIGGGVRSEPDSLLEFKRGFSKQTFGFQLAKVTCNPNAYAELTDARQMWLSERQLETMSGHYFPEYRRPVATRETGLVDRA